MNDLLQRLRTDVLWHQRRGNDTIAKDCAEAADEIERLRADAERYRWLRVNGEPDAGMNYRPDWSCEMYDAAIDAAMKGE